MSSEERGPGGLRREQYALSPSQRQTLGVDRFFPVPEVAAVLDVSEVAVRQAIQRGTLPARKVPSERGVPVISVKGWRVICWRDQIAGLSDGDESQYEEV